MGIIKIPTAAIEKFNANYLEIFSSGNLAEGKWNVALSNFYREYTGSRSAVPFSSNGSGLLAILVLLKRYRSFENIFIQSNTMYGVKTIAITSGLKYVGAVPCSIPSLMPTVGQVKQFCESLARPDKTVFLLTHIGGIVNPDILEIAAICAKFGVALVEDCAHSVGATINGEHAGLFGVAGVYSLYATKSITAGEGGIAVTNDEDLGSQLTKFNMYDRFDQVQDVGVNFRVSELQALFSLCMSEQTEKIIQNKSKIALRYIEACKSAEIQFVDPYQSGQRGNNYKFTLIAKVDATGEFKLIKNTTSPVYDYSLGDDPSHISNRHICLPIWYGLEEEVICKVIDEIYSSKEVVY